MKNTILASVIPMALSGKFQNQKNSDILFSNDIGNHYKNRYSSNICFADGDDAGGDEGNADIDFSNPLIKDYVQRQVNEAITGLKTKNTELLGKYQETKTKLEGYGEISSDQVKKIMGVLQGNEEAQLLADGKFEEVVAKRLDRVKAEYDDKLTGMTSELEKLNGETGKYKKLYQERILGDQLRAIAIKEGVLPEAYDDVLRRGFDIFSLAEDGTIEARNENGELLKDKKDMLLTPERFINALKETSPYYWPASQGSGAQSQTQRPQNGLPSGDIGKLNDVVKGGNFDLEAYRKARGDDQSRYNR
jgi:prefoldin subunit 5